MPSRQRFAVEEEVPALRALLSAQRIHVLAEQRRRRPEQCEHGERLLAHHRRRLSHYHETPSAGLLGDSSDGRVRFTHPGGYAGNAPGTAVGGDPDENEYFKTVNRYRDVTFGPDGLSLFIATDIEGNTRDGSGRPATGVENPGSILEFRYVADQSR